MASPFAAIDAIFDRPRDAAAILFLIEDSTYMAPLWQRLRNSYLPSLLNTIKGANSSAAVSPFTPALPLLLIITLQTETLWMTTSGPTPFKPPFDPSTGRIPSWDDIPAINFSPHGVNIISPASVTRAIEALSATFGRGPATRHLVIAAALNPSADVLGPRGTLAWSTAVERLHQEEIRVHLIVRSQSAMDGLTPLYWELIGKGHAYQSFADDAQFAFYLSDFYSAIDKGKAPAVDNRRVPNSGSQSMTSNDSSASSIDKPSLVYQLQKMNGMEKKRRSRTRRDQPAANKPGQPYQKNYPHTRTSPSTAQSTSSDPSSRSPSRRKDASRVSRVEASSSHFDPPPPRTSPDEHRSPYSSATSPSRSSSPSSPYYPSAGTSSSSPGSRNLSPLRASLPIPTPTFDQFQHMGLTSQSTPDSLSPSSPGYHDFQSYNHELPGDLRSRHPVSRAAPVDGSRLVTAQFNDIYGSNRSSWNECGEQQGRTEPSVYPRSLASYPPVPDGLAPRLAHRPEQATTTSSLPPMPHGLDTPAAENTGGSYFYSGYEDRTAGTSLQNIYLLTDRSSDADSSTNVPYYS
ncbi:hypothetical protein BDM02DRAFT_1589828 [Thelephora ganbajun]|uniref:Uncharacterized protein n=1 Tax=Thelephora ganbajun TaxID=370292 RepID=A0ACB6ZUV7_THEGA|nr:hypothetical protein BDM02DRAFT_1589828 [Thelephora ganbajun]